MTDTVLVQIWMPIFLERFDLEASLLADAGDLLVKCMLWVSEQKGMSVQSEGHFFCNPRTKEIIRKGNTLSDTEVVRGDLLIIF